MNISERLERIETLRRERGLSPSMANRLAQAGNGALIEEVEGMPAATIAALNAADEQASDFERNMRTMEDALRLTQTDALARMKELADTFATEVGTDWRDVSH